MSNPIKPILSGLYLFAIVASMPCRAIEDGSSNYLPGFYGDFAMGVLPDKGVYFSNFMAAYQDKSGKTATLLEMPSLFVVTDYTVLGGIYGFGIYPGVTAIQDRSGATQMERVGLVDTYIVPLTINWKWDVFNVLLYEGIVAPTGYYEKDAYNTGLNIWTFDQVLSLTWELPGDNEISTTLGYMVNTKNDATDYRNGDELHFDYTVGHYFGEAFALGVTGSFYRQVSADRAPIAIRETTFSEAASIGPVVMWTPHINDREVTLSLKWLHEYNVQGRLAQDYLISRFDVDF
ncbi:MAG: transporter [Methylococcaceae bacterium]|nr:transporter [Methylococcaceae bacterium]